MKPEELAKWHDIQAFANRADGTTGASEFHDLSAALIREQAEVLGYAAAWLERWAQHVDLCEGGAQCTCGLTAIRHAINLAEVGKLV